MLSVSQRSVRGRGVWVQGLVGEVEGLVVRVVVVVVGGFGAVVGLVGLLVDSPPERVVTILEMVVFDATEGEVSGVFVRREEEDKMYVGGKVPQVSFCQKTSSSSERY